MYSKIDRYILIAVLVVVIAILYFVYKNKKDTGDQSSLLLAMADKIGAVKYEAPIEEENETIQETEQSNALSEEEWNDIVRIARSRYFKKPLSQWDKKTEEKFKDAIADEIEYCNQFYPILYKLKLHLQLTEEEINFRDKYIAEFEDELQKNNFEIESNNKPDEVDSPNTEDTHSDQQSTISKATPPLASDEKLKIILSLFEDGVIKMVSEMADLYFKKSGVKLHANSSLFGRLEDEEKIKCQHIPHRGSDRVFYGLPEWFEGKKLKKEYALPEWFEDGKLIKKYKSKLA